MWRLLGHRRAGGRAGSGGFNVIALATGTPWRSIAAAAAEPQPEVGPLPRPAQLEVTRQVRRGRRR